MDEINALDGFYLNFPREVAWKGNKFFVRNRYVENAEKLFEKLKEIKTDFFVSVYGFDEYENYRAWDRNKAILNRLFFDFDSKENPKEALKEVKRMVRALDSKPIVLFSGFKGFHVHVVFKRVNVGFETLRMSALKIVELLKLKTCDPQVFEVARLSRAPFSAHSSTNLPCTIIDANRILKMTFDDVVKFAKEGKWDFPDYELDEKVYEMIERSEVIRRAEEERKRAEVQDIPDIEIRGDKVFEKSELGRKKRIKMYIDTLKRYGSLSVNPIIREIHSKSKWVAQHCFNPGAVEHIARVYLVYLMLEEGYSKEEINKVMSLAKDYDPKKTEYYIEYNIRKFREKKYHPVA